MSTLPDRIESEMGSAAPEAQWTMNFHLAGIGIHAPTSQARHRDRRKVAPLPRLSRFQRLHLPIRPDLTSEMVGRQGRESLGEK